MPFLLTASLHLLDTQTNLFRVVTFHFTTVCVREDDRNTLLQHIHFSHRLWTIYLVASFRKKTKIGIFSSSSRCRAEYSSLGNRPRGGGVLPTMGDVQQYCCSAHGQRRSDECSESFIHHLHVGSMWRRSTPSRRRKALY